MTDHLDFPIKNNLFLIVSRLTLSLSTSEQKTFFKWFMSTASNRMNSLAKLIRPAHKGFVGSPQYSFADLEQLDRFLSDNIKPRTLKPEELMLFPRSPKFAEGDPEVSSLTLSDESILLCIDIAIFFGTFMISAVPHVGWTQRLLDDPRYADWGYPLIGKTTSPVLLNPMRIVFVYARTVLDKRPRNDLNGLFTI